MSTPTSGFTGRRQNRDADLPPGQYLTEDFPVLSAGPTPHVRLRDWAFQIAAGPDQKHQWSWDQLQALPRRM